MESLSSFLSEFKIDVTCDQKDLVEFFFRSIIQIAELLYYNNINYAFCGTVGLIIYKQRIKCIPKDIDIIIDREKVSFAFNLFKNNNFERHDSDKKFWSLNNFQIDIMLSRREDFVNDKFKGFLSLGKYVKKKKIKDLEFKYQDPDIILKAKNFGNRLEYEKYGYFLNN